MNTFIKRTLLGCVLAVGLTVHLEAGQDLVLYVLKRDSKIESLQSLDNGHVEFFVQLKDIDFYSRDGEDASSYDSSGLSNSDDEFSFLKYTHKYSDILRILKTLPYKPYGLTDCTPIPKHHCIVQYIPYQLDLDDFIKMFQTDPNCGRLELLLVPKTMVSGKNKSGKSKVESKKPAEQKSDSKSRSNDKKKQ